MKKLSTKIFIIVGKVFLSFCFILLALCCIFIKNNKTDPLFVAKGNGMAPSIKKGDIFKVNKKEIDFKRGDIVYFIAPDSKKYFQRIIGLPGEKIEIKRNNKREGIVYINGKILDEPYRRTLIESSSYKKALHFEPYLIPSHSYFLLGDERDLSYDSRFWKAIKKENITGKVIINFKDIYARAHKVSEAMAVADSERD